DILSHYNGDAKQNYCTRRHLQGIVPRIDSLGLSVLPAASLWSAAPASTGGDRLRIDPRLGLPCGRRCWHAGSTREASQRQGHYRWSPGATARSAAASGFRADHERGPQAQGPAGEASGGLLSGAALVRGGWESVFDHQYATSQKADAQGAQPPGPGGVCQSRRGRDGGTGAAQPAGGGAGSQRGIGDGAGQASLVGSTGAELADQRPILRGARIVGELAGARRAAFFGSGQKESQAAIAPGASRWQRLGGDTIGPTDATGQGDSGSGATRRARALHDGAAVDQFAGLAPASGQGVAGLVWPAVGTGIVLQGIESGPALDPVFAESHPVDGDPRDRGADPGLRRVGRLPSPGGPRGEGGCAADQFSQDPADGSRTVAISGALGRPVRPGASASGGQPRIAANRRPGHGQTPGAVLSAGVAPAGEQLAPASQKHLPQRSGPLLGWNDLCLNS